MLYLINLKVYSKIFNMLHAFICILVTNNIKSGYNCECVSAPNLGHILFECPIVDTIRKEQWQNVIREMPMGITNSVNTMAVNEK